MIKTEQGWKVGKWKRTRGKNPWGKEYPRIRSIHLNRWERPLRATIWTKYGIVRVVWKDVAENRCWFSSGTGDAKQEAVPAIEHVE